MGPKISGREEGREKGREEGREGEKEKGREEVGSVKCALKGSSCCAKNRQ